MLSIFQVVLGKVLLVGIVVQRLLGEKTAFSWRAISNPTLKIGGRLSLNVRSGVDTRGAGSIIGVEFTLLTLVDIFIVMSLL